MNLTYSYILHLVSLQHFYSSFFKLVFPGENDIDQLGIVIRALGTPNEEIWPGVKGIEFKWIV